MLLSAELLSASTTLTERERKAAARIHQSTMRIVDMLRDLEDFSRARLGGFVKFDYEPCNLAKLCDVIIDEIRAARPKARMRISGLGDSTAVVDKKRFVQLLTNLVTNAIQHGSPNGMVTVRTVGNDSGLCIEVNNEGVIDCSEINQIFDPLYRGRSGTRANPRGLGLGLYIARRIAVAHGGSIDVSSSDAEGTQFVVRLPKVNVSAVQQNQMG